jgi:hypothetical protein
MFRIDKWILDLVPCAPRQEQRHVQYPSPAPKKSPRQILKREQAVSGVTQGHERSMMVSEPGYKVS